jgi:hypothetical protein
MYVRVFHQILHSSIARNYVHRHVFEDLLKLADRKGQVDYTYESIAGITNIPVGVIRESIAALMEPDPDSRSSAEEGRRLVLLDVRRSWGWRVVNYEAYRSVRDADALREKWRSDKRALRERKASGHCAECPGMSETEVDRGGPERTPTYTSTSESLKKLSVEVKNSNTVSTSKKEVYSIAFEEFWKHAWRKTAKDPAWKAYRKKATSHAMEEIILASAKRDYPMYMQREIDVRPHMATWLNQERYNDEPEDLTSPKRTRLDEMMDAI